ncbi:unnamed protein product, partial [Timema podura]|nr:unnamed protein product [Timema podura]
TLRQFCDNFLTSGTYCRKLSALAETRHSRHGLIYQALCESVRQYLLFYHHAVMRLPSGSSLLGLWRDYQCYHLQVLGLAQVLLEAVRTPGPLLSRLYHNLSHGVREDNTCTLYFVVRAVLPSSWRSGSLRGTARTNTGNSLYARYQSTPAVIAAITGARDPLCLLLERDHPRLDCYLSEDQLKGLGARCRKYQARALAACGPPTSPAQLFQESSHHESQLHQLVLQAHHSRITVLQGECRQRRLSGGSVENYPQCTREGSNLDLPVFFSLVYCESHDK